MKLFLDKKDNEKDNENEILTKLMEYIRKSNSRKFVGEFAKIRDKDHLQTLLNTRINDTYLIVEAAKKNNLNIVKLLAQQHVNISYTDAKGETALHWSCYNNNDRMCEYFMHYGADPNIVTKSGKETPLIKAAYNGNLNILKHLFNEEKKFLYSFDWVCDIVTFGYFLFLFFCMCNQFVVLFPYVLLQFL